MSVMNRGADKNGIIMATLSHEQIALRSIVVNLELANKEQELTPYARQALRAANAAIAATNVIHGVNCQKRIHYEGQQGFLHAADDDTAYDVDGVAYCGRCHVGL